MGGSESFPPNHMSNLHLFIDARNVLYRAVYASAVDQKYAIKYHCMVIFLRQIVGWIQKYKPEKVHVFWDAPRITVWRKMVLSTYKDRPPNPYIENIGDLLKVNTTVATDLLGVLNVRQYDRRQMEADDLIYAAAALFHPDKSVIVSTDSDLTQIPHIFSSSTVYDPQKMIEVETPKHHPAFMKALIGDKADVIQGYSGIGPKKAAMLLENPKHLQEFLNVKGKETYSRNLLLTDLSLCPQLLANKLYVQKVSGQDVVYDQTKVVELIKTNKIIGLDTEYADLIPAFSKLR
jgi:5'-3' exonuclease